MIELMIVVAICGIIAAIAIPKCQQLIAKSKGGRRMETRTSQQKATLRHMSVVQYSGDRAVNEYRDLKSAKLVSAGVVEVVTEDGKTITFGGTWKVVEE